ncbi:hypothetical protein FRC01_005845 [Tulasnella sp. 417]|nr:hypothetical protein FRC01_005845 [Tulasnella sp. 417]
MASKSLASRIAGTLASEQQAAAAAGASSAAGAGGAAKEAIPKSLAGAVDVEAEIGIERVRVDGLVISKIIKHGRDAKSTASNVSGTLLGIDLQGTLEVSNSFPLPSTSGGSKGGDDDESKASHARYQASMLRQLSFVSGDTTVVGSYHIVSMGQVYKQTILDALVGQMDKVRHGGIAIVHDLTQAARGNSSFKAFRLSPGYLAAHKSGKFHAQSLGANSLTFSQFFVELPLQIRTSPLASAFLKTVLSPSASSSAVPAPGFSNLSLPAPTTHTRALDLLLETLDQSKSEENNVAYQSRQIARERAKADGYLAKKREENAQRIAQGLAPFAEPREEDVRAMFKVPPEPSRLDSVMLMGQVDAVAKEVELLQSVEIVKMYAARAGATTA